MDALTPQLLGPLGLLAGALIAIIANVFEIWVSGRTYRRALVEKDQRYGEIIEELRVQSDQLRADRDLYREIALESTKSAVRAVAAVTPLGGQRRTGTR